MIHTPNSDLRPDATGRRRGAPHRAGLPVGRRERPRGAGKTGRVRVWEGEGRERRAVRRHRGGGGGTERDASVGPLCCP